MTDKDTLQAVAAVSFLLGMLAASIVMYFILRVVEALA